MTLRSQTFKFVTCVLGLALMCTADENAAPKVGERAPDFELNSLAGKTVKLSDQLKHGTVVVVVLRGWPGYQCPLCSRQVGELLGRANDFAKLEASVLMIYPGPENNLMQRAQEFVGQRKLPEQFTLLVDPDYRMITKWGLRWEQERETSYPSTFVVDSAGTVKYAKISQTHGDRAATDEVLKALSREN